MEEPSSCALEQGYSCAAETINGGGEALSVCAFGGSISFGRFMSESLDWGRWSSFRHNRYLEDVEKYSTPGVVAQKKAYFEARYKKIAAKKLATANVMSNTGSNMENSNEKATPRVSFEMKSKTNAEFNTIDGESSAEVAMHEGEVLEMTTTNKLMEASNSSEMIREENVVLVMESKSFDESNSQVGSPVTAEAVENQCNDVIMQFSRISPSSKAPLKESFVTNQGNTDSAEKKPRVSASRSSIHRSSRCLFSSASMFPPSPAKPAPSTNCTKENKLTPRSWKHGTGSCDKNKSTLKSLHMSINLTQDRQGVTPPHVTRISSVREKIQRLEVASESFKGSKGSLQTFRTPKRVSSTKIAKVPSVTSESEKRRTRMPSEHAFSRRRKVEPYPCTISIDYSNSSRTTVNRTQPQIASSPFRFRTDERAEKRKEFHLNLDDRLTAKGANKAQLQEESKEKAENGVSKLPPSSCFKARSMPSFYKVIEPKSDIKKISLAKPQSPNFGRSASTIISSPNLLTPIKTSLKTERPKHPVERNSQTARHSAASLTNKHS